MPAGTVSGAPGVRAMEIIDELELKNAVFTAVVWDISVRQDMDMCRPAHSDCEGRKALYSGRRRRCL